MNITLDKYFKMLMVVCLLLVASLVEAQTELSTKQNSNFKIGVELGGGYGFKLRSTNKLEGNYSSSGMNYTLRLKWGSGNIFSAGIETGYLTVSSIESANQTTPLGITEWAYIISATIAVFAVGMILMRITKKITKETI